LRIINTEGEIKENWSQRGQQRRVRGGGVAGHFNVLKRPEATTD